MSRFYGSLKGQAKTECTRRGGPASGVEAHVRGWELGVRARAFVAEDGRDCVEVLLTRGSNARDHETALGTWALDEFHGLVKIA